MPEGRFVSRKISQNEQLGNVSLRAAFFFTWCIPHLDRDGRMTGNTALLKSNVCPLRLDIEEDDIPGLLCELSPLVRWYELAGKAVLEFPGFRGEQKGKAWYDREAESRFPQWDSSALDLVQSWSGPALDEVRLSEVQVQAQGEVRGSDAIASEGEPSLEELHALVRTRLHRNNQSSEANQSHSRLRRDMWGRMKPADIRDGILGLCKLRDRGVISGWSPEFGLRQALRWHHEGRQLWDAALDEERHGSSNGRTPTTSARIDGAPMTGVGEILKRAVNQ